MRTPFVLSIAIAVLSSSVAHAGDKARADKLFDEGKKELTKGNWDAACVMFQASEDVDPAVSTMLKLAKCREHEGKYAAAYRQIEAARKLNAESGATATRKEELDAFAKKQIEDLAPHLPKIRVSVVAASNASVPGAKVSIGDREIAAGEDALVGWIDAGAVEVAASAPGYRAAQKRVDLAAGKTVEVTLALAQEAPAAPVATTLPPKETPKEAPTAAPIAAPPPSAPPAPPIPRATARFDEPYVRPATPDRIDARRVAGVTMMAAGVVAGGVAIGFAVDTLSKVGSLSQYCAPDRSTCFDQRGLDLEKSARGSQAAGLAFGGVAVALAAGGVVLFATAPKRAHPANVDARLVARGSSLSIEGSF